MMAEIEMLKKTVAKQICYIVDGLNMELNKHNIDGDTYQATMASEEAKIVHAMM